MSENALQDRAAASRAAQRKLAAAGPQARTDILRHLERLLREPEAELIAANKLDLEAAEGTDLPEPILERLALTSGQTRNAARGDSFPDRRP